MLKTRIITAVIGIPLLLAILFWGGLAWTTLFVLMAGIALYEYLNMMKAHGQTPPYLSAYSLLLVLLFREPLADYFLPLLVAIVVLNVMECVIMYPKYKLEDIALTFLGAFYIGFLISYALLIKSLEQPFLVILLVLLVTWGSDVGGYLFGRLWGRTKMSPQLSPNKTWAGAIGGVVLAILAAGIFYYLFPLPALNLVEILALAGIGSVTAQLGDLFASAMKRYFGAKDSGHIIPGHGGVLDRFDSFMLVLPVLYYSIYFCR